MQEKNCTSDDFSQIFCILLKQSCLSQKEVAARSGIHQQTINRYATGKTVPSWTELVKLAEAIGCTFESFRTGRMEPATTRETFELAKQMEEIKPIINELGSVVGRLTSFISR